MYNICAFYKFNNLKNPNKTQTEIRRTFIDFQIVGTVLLGHEGINGTVSSTSKQNLNKAIKYIRGIEGFKNIDLKYSFTKLKPFARLKVKLKKEIVTIGDESINPNLLVGDYVKPSEWNELINGKDVLLIDTRNNYEYSIGTFKDSINPNIKKFSEFPEWIKSQNFSEIDKENKKIAMFCTGGIRCEKASSLMKKQGFKKVFHLKGGILKYFESITKKESLWNGECFVFDDRVSLNYDLSSGTYDMCHGCRMPITDNDKESTKYIRGVACPNCFDKTTKNQKRRYSSRQKQIDLAKKHNKRHIGPKEEILS